MRGSLVARFVVATYVHELTTVVSCFAVPKLWNSQLPGSPDLAPPTSTASAGTSPITDWAPVTSAFSLVLWFLKALSASGPLRLSMLVPGFSFPWSIPILPFHVSACMSFSPRGHFCSFTSLTALSPSKGFDYPSILTHMALFTTPHNIFTASISMIYLFVALPGSISKLPEDRGRDFFVSLRISIWTFPMEIT